jgi:hypothetical protein
MSRCVLLIASMAFLACSLLGRRPDVGGEWEVWVAGTSPADSLRWVGQLYGLGSEPPAEGSTALPGGTFRPHDGTGLAIPDTSVLFGPAGGVRRSSTVEFRGDSIHIAINADDSTARARLDGRLEGDQVVGHWKQQRASGAQGRFVLIRVNK